MIVSRAADAAPASAAMTAARWSQWVVVGTILLGLAATGLPTAAYDVFVLVVVCMGLLAGLPHGSIDHRLAAELTGWSRPIVTGAYAGLAVLAWVALTAGGPLVLVVVLALSLVHFGLGELESVRETTGWTPSPPIAVSLAVAGLGALLLPLARSGPQLSAVAESISPQLGELLAYAPVRVALVGVWVIAAALAGIAALRARRQMVAVDIVLVGALGMLAPPLVAFAIWFGGWHALRHCARLLKVDVRSAGLVAGGHPRRAVLALARLAAWPSVAALVVLAGLLLATLTAADTSSAVGTTLLVLLALTVPHMVVVLWLDRRPIGASPPNQRR